MAIPRQQFKVTPPGGVSALYRGSCEADQVGGASEALKRTGAAVVPVVSQQWLL